MAERVRPVVEPRREATEAPAPRARDQHVGAREGTARAPPERTSRAAPAPRAPEVPPAVATRLVQDPGYRTARHDAARALMLEGLQQTRGNRSVARLAAAGSMAAQPASPATERYVERSRGAGESLEPAARGPMERGFGRDLGHVRVHTDGGAADAARDLGARAFASGRDLYFGHGRYAPGTPQGRRLLAHEVAHTLQQPRPPGAAAARLSVGAPDDPREREADAAAHQVMAGERVTAPLGGHGGPPLRRVDDDAPEPPPAPEPAAQEPPPDEPGALVVHLGRGIRIGPDKLSGGRRRKQADLTQGPQTVPGLQLKKLVYRPRAKAGEIYADLAVPYARGLRKDLRLGFDAEGKASFRANSRLPLAIGALKNPELDLEVDGENQVAASLRVTADRIKPRGLPKLSMTGGGTVRLAQGRLAGEVKAQLAYAGLAKGDFQLGFDKGVPTGGGRVDITQPFLEGVSAGLHMEKGDLKADVTVPASRIAPPIPGLTVPEGSVQLIMLNGDLSGTISGLKLVYKGLGEASLASATIAKGQASGTGSFALKIPAIEPVTGSFGYRRGRLFGSVTVRASNFPEALPVTGGQVTGRIDEKGEVSFGGKVAITLGGAGSGELRGQYETGRLALGADVRLTVPGLEGTEARIDYVDGDLEGEVDVPIASEKLAGISGTLHVEYREKRWKGEQTIGYQRDNGKLKGNVTIGLMQKEDGDLAVYGGGDVTAQLTSFLAGTLKLDILPEGKTTLGGAITVTEPLKLFPEKKADRELFNISRNIPLWAILVAVIRVRGGVRAGIGPGQLRDITVEGEYTIGEATPSFVIRGELFIPAYAEAYVAIGAGLGLDVVLGSLTGGIEAVGTAGIYGAVSVIPEIAYENGDYRINGTATMAAAAKLKLGLQAWAEIEALWITVWENTWHLAEWVWDVGPTLALQADMSYTFGRPEAPKLEFKTDDIDAEKLVQDAMPKEGPKGSGAREALKNKAEWSGPTKGKGKEADRVPEEAAQKKKPAPAPKAPPKPSRRPKPGPGEAPPKRAVKEKGAKRTPALEKTIDQAARKQAEKDKAAEAAARAPRFPPPSAREIEINWANYLEETRGRGPLDRAGFARKMRSGEVYHPKLDGWRTLERDYAQASPSLSGRDKAPDAFARKMRGGYYAGSLRRDSDYDPSLETPVPDGSAQKPYPIHWPREFLVSGFENFTVAGGVVVRRSPRKAYTFDTGTRTYTYEFGVAGSFQAMMAPKQKLKRQDPGRNPSNTATEWDRWRRIGFAGGAGSTATKVSPPPVQRRDADASLFRRRELPDGTSTPAGETYGQFIEADPGFADYQALTHDDRAAFRAAARAGEFDITRGADVRSYAGYLAARREEAQSQRGVIGYEMQHVVPLYLAGSSADTRENMWPLSVSQHRRGHDILKNQPQLPAFKAPTHNLESSELRGKWFVIRAYGSSL